jgi:exodeoxyribonuclease VII large subunit
VGQLPLVFAQSPTPKKDPSPDVPPAAMRDPVSVSELQSRIRDRLETSFPRVLVAGEISGLSVHSSSGHAYFTLKDASAQLRCVMWRDQLKRIPFGLEDGQEVIAEGRVTVYQRGGSMQLSVTSVTLRGAGAIGLAIQQRLARLREEGLTDVERKKPLPRFPQAIGIVTSRNAAALRDVLRTALRRDPKIHLVFCHAPVQGDDAPVGLRESLSRLDASELVDVILLVRGGGSFEDLLAFQDEDLARAIANAKTPIVTGIGHETDTTIADYVSDQRASTPTAAAELVVPLRTETEQRIQRLLDRLIRSGRSQLARRNHALLVLEKRIRHPGTLLRERAQQLDEIRNELDRRALQHVRRANERVRLAERGMERHPPRLRLETARHRLERARSGAERAIRQGLDRRRSRLAVIAARLDALSPLSALERGYAIARDTQGRVIRSKEQVVVGASISLRVARGTIEANVTGTRD